MIKLEVEVKLELTSITCIVQPHMQAPGFVNKLTTNSLFTMEEASGVDKVPIKALAVLVFVAMNVTIIFGVNSWHQITSINVGF